MALTDWLIAYYKFETNANDSLWSYNLTWSNVSYNTWKIGGWASTNWSGTSNLSASTNFGIDWWNITLSFWVKMNSEISSWIQSIINQTSWWTDVWYLVTYEYNWWTRRLVFDRVRQWIADDQFTYNTTLWTSNYHYIVLTYNWTAITWYLDWSQVWALNCSWNWSFERWNVFAISWLAWDKTIYPANISIDETWIWNRAISSTEVTQLYNSWAWLTYPFSSSANTNPSFLLNFL